MRIPVGTATNLNTISLNRKMIGTSHSEVAPLAIGTQLEMAVSGSRLSMVVVGRDHEHGTPFRTDIEAVASQPPLSPNGEAPSARSGLRCGARRSGYGAIRAR
jgi:hypothetical protein